MGESAVANHDPRLGSVAWASWTNKASNEALIKQQLVTLLPVQEMLPFQRQIRELDLSAGPSAGQQAIFTAQVPDDEAWRMIDATYVHDDSTTHIMRWTYTPRGGAGAGLRMITRKAVNMNTETPLYRSFSDEESASRFAPRGQGPVEFFPRDVVDFFDLTAATDANVTATLRLRYELIPLPRLVELDDIFTQQSI